MNYGGMRKRKKRIPLPKSEPESQIDVIEDAFGEGAVDELLMEPHELRKRELSRLHGIPEVDIFVDRKNGVELYRNIHGNWVHDPANREV
jgi:hypothetical protein